MLLWHDRGKLPSQARACTRLPCVHHAYTMRSPYSHGAHTLNAPCMDHAWYECASYEYGCCWPCMYTADAHGVSVDACARLQRLLAAVDVLGGDRDGQSCIRCHMHPSCNLRIQAATLRIQAATLRIQAATLRIQATSCAGSEWWFCSAAHKDTSYERPGCSAALRGADGRAAPAPQLA